MTSPLDALPLFGLARAARFPRVWLGSMVIEGEAAWRRACFGSPAAIPRERLTLLRGLAKYHLLVASEAGRQKLRFWLERERATPSPLESQAELRARLSDEVAFFGDIEMLPAVVDALVHMPRPVRDVVLGSVAFLGCGWSTHGFVIASDFSWPDGRSRPRAVLLNGADHDLEWLQHVTRHEGAHAWLLPSTDLIPAVPARGHARVRELARTEGWLAAADARTRHDELLAEALAICWGSDVVRRKRPA